MILSLKKKAPVTDGVYPVRVTKIEKIEGVVTKSGVRDKYSFTLLLNREQGAIEIVCDLFWSNYEHSPFAQFLSETAVHYELPPGEDIDTDEFLNKTVWAKLSSYRDKAGNEYPSLDWFAPYNVDFNNLELEDEGHEPVTTTTINPNQSLEVQNNDKGNIN